MSRRKAPAERSRVKSHADNEQEEAREKKGRTREKGDTGRETPSKAGGRLSRSGRPRGVQLPTQSAPPPKSERDEEEPCLNKKTPKRLSKSKSWMSTIHSPSNDTEQQHEIFWDPHSPTPFKLENGKRKQAANKCAVDISDIVNRIAPKTEKSTNPDAVYLGMWIGDDAIPCTPVVARDRTKMTRFRTLHTEEELMKLAKQFDRNLVETVHRDQNGSMDQLDEDQINDTEPASDTMPEEDVALDLKSVSQHSDVDLQYQRSSQKSVDLRAEADFNALFDSSTQKYSGQLSQSSSAVSSSTNSRHPVGIEASGAGNLSADKQDQLCEKPTCSKQAVLNSDVFHTPAKDNTHAQKASSTPKEPTLLSSVPLSQDDFEDEWGTDILEDDSFVMQITQNPSLIATPKQDSPASLPLPADHGFQDTKNVTSSVNCEDASAESNKPSHFKFVLKNRNECGKDAKPSSTGNSKTATMMSKAIYHSDVSGTATTKMNLDLPVAKPNNNDPAPGAGFVGGSLKNSSNTTIFAVQPSTSRQGNPLSVKFCPQTVASKRASSSKGSDDWEWEDPKLSDELLDMFSESDRLWETKEEDDDDDDLLYQVCDDVERLTQAQMEEEHDKIKPVPSSNLTMSSNPRESMTNKERLHQSRLGTQTVTSNSTNSVSMRCNAIIETSNRSANGFLNTATQVTYGTPENNSSRTGQAASVLHRSTSVPLGGQCDYKKATPKDTDPQNQVPKYTFTRIKPSQVSLGSTSANNDKLSSAKDAFCGIAGNKTQCSSDLQASVHSHHQSSLKRQLSESILKSTKVFVAEAGNKKCSLEEIERKKQEALARRQTKAHGFSYDASRT
uniref:ETAA1 activator of ATR kinase n=1 Tax=Leptobrachium leishanense TaxID=445787 RepID=A0A8C5MRT5_9ANUR